MSNCSNIIFLTPFNLYWLHDFVIYVLAVDRADGSFCAQRLYICRAPACACEKAICQRVKMRPSTYRVITGPLDRHDWARANSIQNLNLPKYYVSLLEGLVSPK
jgi:hypothetical protein